jgi:delta-lactam-biosynthetic de-N-acetylase
MGENKHKVNSRLKHGMLVLVFSLLLLWGAVAADAKKQLRDGNDQLEYAVAEMESQTADSATASERDNVSDESDASENPNNAESSDFPEESDDAEDSDSKNLVSDSESEMIQGQIIVNEPVTDIESLDTTVRDWGLGKNRDDDGRPIDAVKAQEQYGAYNALFLGEGENTIYLTFDEGYENGFTESILDTLKEKGVKAVFFVTGYYAKSQPELVQRMIDEGHVIGNHSASHPADGLTSLSWEQQQDEVMENHEYVLEQFDYYMYLFRYPSGRFSEQSLALVNNCNYKSVFWSFAYVDYDVNNQPDQVESLAKMEDKLHPGAIYLLHAESETNAAILGELIDYIAEQGYSFGTL